MGERTGTTFSEKIKANKEKLKSTLKGKSVVGLSAPAKGNTLLNYCEIDLPYIGEINELKIGKFTPGRHIPVVHEDQIIEDQPDYVLILAWNWSDYLIQHMREKGYRGKFIIPIPEPEIIGG
jgi:hypothetical protein